MCEELWSQGVFLEVWVEVGWGQGLAIFGWDVYGQGGVGGVQGTGGEVWLVWGQGGYGFY